MVLNGVLRLFHLTLTSLWFKQTVQTLIRRPVLWRLIWVCIVCQCPKCPSPGFTDISLYQQHSDVTTKRIAPDIKKKKKKKKKKRNVTLISYKQAVWFHFTWTTSLRQYDSAEDIGCRCSFLLSRTKKKMKIIKKNVFVTRYLQVEYI